MVRRPGYWKGDERRVVKRFDSRITKNAFFILILCIVIPSTVVFSLWTYSYLKNENDIYVTTKLNQAAQVGDAFEYQLALMGQTAHYFLSSNWVGQMNSHLDLYPVEFDSFKKNEIKSEVASHMFSLPFASGILVCIDRRELYITPHGWFEKDGAKSFYDYLDFTDTHDIKSSDPNILPVSYESMFVRDTVVYILVDKSRLSDYVEKITLEQFSAFELYKDGEPLVAWPPGEREDIMTETYESRELSNGFRLTLSYKPYKFINSIGNFGVMITLIIFLYIFAVFISYFLASIATKPVNKLLARLSRVKGLPERKDYTHLSEYVDGIINNNAELASRLEQFEKRTRNEALYRLLSDPAVASNPDEYILELIPWAKENLPYQIIFMVSKHEFPPVDRPDINAYGSGGTLRVLRVGIPNCDEACIVWYLGGGAASVEENVLREHIPAWYVAFSDLYADLKQINAAYIQTRSRLDVQLALNAAKPGVATAMSLSQETVLIHAVLDNRQRDCEKILREMTKHVGLDALSGFMMLLVRLANEHAVRCREYVEKFNMYYHQTDFESIRNTLDEFCAFLCSEINAGKTRNAADLAQLVYKYIRENYANCELSLKHLSGIFNVSLSLISKLFKTEYDINFVDFLLDIRIKQAKKLMEKDKALPLTEVSQAVGYENYLSFKRAFMRVEGISPREYREGDTAKQ